MGLHLKLRLVSLKQNIFCAETKDNEYTHHKLVVYSADSICMTMLNKQQYKRSKAKELKSLVLYNLLWSRDKTKRMLAINIINNLEFP